MESEKLLEEIERLRDAMAETLIELIRIPAIAPENGGEGEAKKAEKLLQILSATGFDTVKRFDAEDKRVPSGRRPNIIASLSGIETKETLWIVSHMDVVPPGEDSLWSVTKPFDPLIKDGKIYGRGSEDNTQSIVSSIFAARALKNMAIKPKRTVALCFVADEEIGSEHGIQHLVKKGLFKKEDLVVVPDGGNEEGSFIEIAEKSAMWLRVHTIGKQTHASKPDAGLNAHRVGMQYALALDKMLHEKYHAKDEYFDPPQSTFEPTKKEKNVDAINIVPGEDKSYFDCRILPRYSLEAVLSDISKLATEFERKTHAEVKIELIHKAEAPKPTDPNAKVVLLLKEAIKKVRRLEPKVGGIGGGTCAAFFRKIGIPAVVWSTTDETGHQPDEYSKIQNLVDDAKTLAYMAAS